MSLLCTEGLQNVTGVHRNSNNTGTHDDDDTRGTACERTANGWWVAGLDTAGLGLSGSSPCLSCNVTFATFTLLLLVLLRLLLLLLLTFLLVMLLHFPELNQLRRRNHQ